MPFEHWFPFQVNMVPDSRTKLFFARAARPNLGCLFLLWAVVQSCNDANFQKTVQQVSQGAILV